MRLTSLFVALTCATPILATDKPPSEADVRFFETRIRPVLVEQCLRCHGPDRQRSDLRVDRREHLLKGGATGPALVPGNPAQSLLLQALQHTGDLRMPPDRKLSERQIADFTQWVQRGAAFPATQTNAADKSSAFWAFQPPRQPVVPQVKEATWARTPVDRFILAQLEAKGLRPAPPADPRTLLRRLTFDLTGLPPTPEEVHAFEQAYRRHPQSAIEQTVDRLLAAPAYGERWGRHWLDVARYADSNGLDENIAHGNAWRYRDYIIASFNADKPFDQLIREQLAGDLLPTTDPVLRNERLIATGFLTLGPKVLAEADKKKLEMDLVDEQVDTVGKAFLALTLGCARCHDHKFDPIETTDYYALAGIFVSTRTMESLKTIARWHENPLHSPAFAAQKAAHEANVQALEQQIKQAKPEQQKAIKEQLAELQKTAPEGPSAMGVTEGTCADLPVHIRGNHLQLGAVVPRGFPRVIAGSKPPAIGGRESGRLQLADWLTRPDHPLTARVLVNRLWRWHFGRGLVSSTDNFGRLGERPSHPELLDWLALRFIQDGWSIKRMHRLLLLSSTYQMGSDFNAQAAEIDPDNRWQWRHNLRRLEAEAVRDSLLAVSGLLDRTPGGSLLHVKNREFFFDHTSIDKTRYDSLRRAIYLPVVRNNLYDAFQLFDFTDAAVMSSDRATTTVAPQALFLLNSELVMNAAEALAQKMLRLPVDDRQRFEQLYIRAYARPPSSQEVQQAEEVLRRVTEQLAAEKQPAAQQRLQAWTLLCHTLLAANEFIYTR